MGIFATIVVVTPNLEKHNAQCHRAGKGSNFA